MSFSEEAFTLSSYGGIDNSLVFLNIILAIFCIPPNLPEMYELITSILAV